MYDAILVVVDRFTKYAFYIPCMKSTSAEDLAMILLERVYAHIGVPSNVVSDRGSVFTSAFWSTLCYCLNSSRKLTTAYHPQTDGQTERQNQTLEHYLRAYVNWNQDDWPQWLPIAQLVYNKTTRRGANESPAQSLMGYRPRFQINIEGPEESAAQNALERAEDFQRNREKLAEQLGKAVEAMEKQYNKNRKDMQFAVGGIVMLDARNVNQARPSRKLSNRYRGPFEVTHVWRQSYKLRLYPEMRRLHDTFHVSLLHKYTGNPRRAPKPGPLFIDEEEEYEVGSIIADRRYKGELQFLVRWRGWDSNYNTWEPLNHVRDTVALDAYEKQQHPLQKRKRGRPTASTNYTES